MIRGIHHISMKCGSPEVFAETKRFYTEVLGLPVVREWDKGMMIETGNCWLEIGNDETGSTERGAIRHFAFFADEIDGLAERIRAAGYNVFMEPKEVCIPCEPAVPARIAFCRGPLGEEIEFFFDKSVNAERYQ